MAADDIIKNFNIRVLLDIFILANSDCTETYFRGLLEPQIFSLVSFCLFKWRNYEFKIKLILQWFSNSRSLK